MASQIRQNYHLESEAAINHIVNLELKASYVYLSLKPDADEWQNGTHAMESALNLEKRVNHALLELHTTARTHTDPHMCDFLESKYLHKETKLIKKLGDHFTNLKRVKATEVGMGEYLFDKLTLGEDSN
ncbi:ferritin light chain, oocyte isoform-like [Pelobates cultripes]|uniref:Ferritin n=1 Tax=Pelobates cultripes TaxID=61616 RepID=A0AAD1WRH3_PELCU|nr:ferritin light chain, oocyte isoform-like [Pelobates cultripes]